MLQLPHAPPATSPSSAAPTPTKTRHNTCVSLEAETVNVDLVIRKKANVAATTSSVASRRSPSWRHLTKFESPRKNGKKVAYLAFREGPQGVLPSLEAHLEEQHRKKDQPYQRQSPDSIRPSHGGLLPLKRQCCNSVTWQAWTNNHCQNRYVPQARQPFIYNPVSPPPALLNHTKTHPKIFQPAIFHFL